MATSRGYTHLYIYDSPILRQALEVVHGSGNSWLSTLKWEKPYGDGQHQRAFSIKRLIIILNNKCTPWQRDTVAFIVALTFVWLRILIWKKKSIWYWLFLFHRKFTQSCQTLQSQTIQPMIQFEELLLSFRFTQDLGLMSKNVVNCANIVCYGMCVLCSVAGSRVITLVFW